MRPSGHRVAGASPCQGEGRRFEPGVPLQTLEGSAESWPGLLYFSRNAFWLKGRAEAARAGVTTAWMFIGAGSMLFFVLFLATAEASAQRFSIATLPSLESCRTSTGNGRRPRTLHSQ